MLSERRINQISIGVTVLFHALLLSIPLSENLLELKQRKLLEVPVNFEMKEIVVEKTEPPVEEKVEKAVAPKKAISEVEEPKKMLPGDRKQAEVVTSALPFYPKEPINHGYEGTIAVKATIDENGKLLTATITKSTGHKVLDDIFIKTLYSAYLFKPKRMYGNNEQDSITITYRFEL
jgi:TonB family protein